MQVDGLVYTSERLLPQLQQDATLSQVVNVAQLPGIIGQSMAMPDAHQGYGFPIGGRRRHSIWTGGLSRPAASAMTSIAACV